MSITLKQIRYFIAAAEEGRVSAAANAVNVSQSAVTLAIRDLEASLGVELFTRTHSGVELTREGHAFLTHARQIQDQVNHAVLSIRNDDDPVTGTLRVGATFTLSSYFLFPKLAQLKRQHPGIDVQLVEAERPALQEMVVSGDVDIALLITSNVVRRDALEILPFHRSRRHLWTAAGHPLMDQPSVSLKDLVGVPYVILQADETERQVARIWGKHGVEPNIVFRSPSIEAVRNMVANGLAVTILSDVVFRPWTVDGLRVARRKLVEPVPSLEVGVVWSKTREVSRPMREMTALFTATGEPPPAKPQRLPGPVRK